MFSCALAVHVPTVMLKKSYLNYQCVFSLHVIGMPPHVPSMMEKKNVDDLFRRLVQVGVIKVMPETRPISPIPVEPPPMQAQPQPQPQLKPEAPKEDITIPQLELVPSELKM